MERPSLRARHFGQFLGLTQNLDRFVGDLFAKRSEADDAAGPLDEGDPEQSLELAQPRRQRRLGDEAGIGGAAEMPEPPQRDQILQLLDSRQMDDH